MASPWPDTASSYCDVGATYREKGNHEKALVFESKALEIRRKRLGEEHPDTANSLFNTGMVLWHFKPRRKEAVDHIEQAYKILQQRLGENHPDTRLTKKELKFRSKKIKRR